MSQADDIGTSLTGRGNSSAITMVTANSETNENVILESTKAFLNHAVKLQRLSFYRVSETCNAKTTSRLHGRKRNYHSGLLTGFVIYFVTMTNTNSNLILYNYSLLVIDKRLNQRWSHCSKMLKFLARLGVLRGKMERQCTCIKPTHNGESALDFY